MKLQAKYKVTDQGPVISYQQAMHLPLHLILHSHPEYSGVLQKVLDRLRVLIPNQHSPEQFHTVHKNRNKRSQ
jgi:hypothetical protein